jgi:hypothetical protein
MQPRQKPRKDQKTLQHTQKHKEYIQGATKKLQHNKRTERKNGSRKNPTKLVGRDYPSAPRLRGKAGKKTEQVNHQQENTQERKSTYDDPWRRLMMMTESRLSRKTCNPYKHKHTKQKRASNPNYEI